MGKLRTRKGKGLVKMSQGAASIQTQHWSVTGASLILDKCWIDFPLLMTVLHYDGHPQNLQVVSVRGVW